MYYSGQSLNLWAAAVSTDSSSKECLLNIDASGPFSSSSFLQVFSVNESTIRAYLVLFPEPCDKCSILFNLKECTNGASLVFAGISTLSDDNTFSLCDQDVSFTSNPPWSTGTDSTEVGNFTCASTEPATISSHSTNIDGSAFSLSFHGSGIAIFGSINVTSYSVVCSLISQEAVTD